MDCNKFIKLIYKYKVPSYTTIYYDTRTSNIALCNYVYYDKKNNNIILTDLPYTDYSNYDVLEEKDSEDR